MHKFTVESPTGHMVGSGEIIGLSPDQLALRRRQVEVLGKPAFGVTPVRVLEAVQFKAGEVIYLERDPAPVAATPALARPPAAASKPKKLTKSEVERAYNEGVEAGRKQAYDDGVKAGRAALLEEIKARNVLFDAADAAAEAVERAKAALEAEADEAKRGPLQQALDAARAAQAEADKAVQDLPEIEA